MHLHFSVGWTLGIHCSALVQMGRAFGWVPIGVGKCNALLISIQKANRNPLSLLNIGVSYKHLFLAIRKQNYIAGCVNPSAKWKMLQTTKLKIIKVVEPMRRLHPKNRTWIMDTQNNVLEKGTSLSNMATYGSIKKNLLPAHIYLYIGMVFWSWDHQHAEPVRGRSETIGTRKIQKVGEERG